MNIFFFFKIELTIQGEEERYFTIPVFNFKYVIPIF